MSYLQPSSGTATLTVQAQVSTAIYDQFPGGTAGTIRLSATSVRPGDTLTISGVLVRLDNNQGVPNQTIYITTSPSLFSTQTTTGTGGSFSVNATIPTNAAPGNYTITAEFRGATV